MNTAYICESCRNEIQLRWNAGKKIRPPRLCFRCHTAQMQRPPKTARTASEWALDAWGNLSRTVEGGV